LNRKENKGRLVMGFMRKGAIFGVGVWAVGVGRGFRGKNGLK